jgi:UDP-hydrolysing UDP-N-acetyl-D-glucosamine 2-epimerase
MRILVLSTSRADYGILRPVFRALRASPRLDPRLVVSGDLLEGDGAVGRNETRRDGFAVEASIPLRMASSRPADVARTMSRAVAGFADVFASTRPDLVFVTGDRFEMFAAAAAAVPFAIPMAHLHGGELTQGAFDDPLRHAITKLSHVHFASTAVYARRIAQLGESPDRIHVVGAPSLDNLADLPIEGCGSLEARLDLSLETPPLLVTLHPETLRYAEVQRQAAAVLAALEELELPCVFTGPNPDTGSDQIRTAFESFCRRHAHSRYIPHLGQSAYFELMRRAAAMVGNSSSGIIEAPSFQLPVVNIGDRQQGRLQAGNVVNAPFDGLVIAGAIRKAISPSFCASLVARPNPYGDGQASSRIVAVLENLPPRDALVHKPFVDWAPPMEVASCLAR